MNSEIQEGNFDELRKEYTGIKEMMADSSIRLTTDEVAALWKRRDELKALLGLGVVGLRRSQTLLPTEPTSIEDFDSAFLPSVSGKGKNKGKGKSKGKDSYARCHETHQTLSILAGEFRGGSCGHPKVGFDIYIGLDYSMAFFGKHYPWEEESAGNPEHEFQYKITDGHAPSDAESFKAMIEWMAQQLDAGKKIHVGCIGGHGRTGLVLAALVSVCLKEEDPIQWVRDHYCKKAVESAEQVSFLVKHFGAKKAKGSKEGVYQPVVSNWGAQMEYEGAAVAQFNAKYPARPLGPSAGGYVEVKYPAKARLPVVVSHVPVKGSLWVGVDKLNSAGAE